MVHKKAICKKYHKLGLQGKEEMSESLHEQFLLKWNNHQKNFTAVSCHLLENDILTDVTVESHDKKKFRCHKLVLATCSSFFFDILINIKDENVYPYIYLTDVRSTVWEYISTYMYKGEVTVPKCDLDELLKAGRVLDVKGLVDFEGYSSREVLTPESTVPTTTGIVPAGSGYISPTNLASSTNNSYDVPKHFIYNPPFLQQFQQSQLNCSIQNTSPYHLYNNDLLSCQAVIQQGLSRTYENIAETSPLTLKKKHSNQQNANTILRRALDDAPAQGVSPPSSSNNSVREFERRNSGEMSEDDKSPNKSQTSSNNQKSGSNSGLPKEWKRYKQYTRENIQDAMNAVRMKKMSALMAAKHYSVPSRTLYDKLKKAGIIPSRNNTNSTRVSSSGSAMIESSARFPYSSSSLNTVYGNRANSITDIDNEMNGSGSLCGSIGEAEVEQADEAMDMSNSSPPTSTQQNVTEENMVEDLSVKPKDESKLMRVPEEFSVILPAVHSIKKEDLEMYEREARKNE